MALIRSLTIVALFSASQASLIQLGTLLFIDAALRSSHEQVTRSFNVKSPVRLQLYQFNGTDFPLPTGTVVPVKSGLPSTWHYAACYV